jgi:hypothetical protein
MTQQRITWEMVVTDREPVLGEIRYVRKFAPNPAEPLAQLFPHFEQVIWDGLDWMRKDGRPAFPRQRKAKQSK